MKAALLIETPRTGAGMDFVKSCKSNNIHPIIFIKEPEAVPAWVMEDYHNEDIEIHKVDTYDFETLRSACIEVQEKYELIAILSLYEYSTVIAAAVATSLGLKSPNLETVAIFRDKSSFRSFLEENSLNTVKYVVHDLTKPLDLLKKVNLQYPLVIKPVNLTGSAFVRKCSNEKELLNAFEEIRSLGEYTGQKIKNHILIEEYIEGEEFSVEVLNGQIVAIVKKHIKEPGFIEEGHDLPAPLNQSGENMIRSSVEKLVRLSGYTFGLLHIELKLNKGGVHFIEANPRVAGGRIPELVRHVYGIDLIDQYLLSLVGRETDISTLIVNKKLQHASIRFKIAEDDGSLKTYTPINLEDHNHIFEYKFYKNLGESFTVNRSNKDRICHVMAISPSIAENEEAINDVFNELKIEGVSMYEYSDLK